MPRHYDPYASAVKCLKQFFEEVAKRADGWENESWELHEDPLSSKVTVGIRCTIYGDVFLSCYDISAQDLYYIDTDEALMSHFEEMVDAMDHYIRNHIRRLEEVDGDQ